MQKKDSFEARCFENVIGPYFATKPRLIGVVNISCIVILDTNRNIFSIYKTIIRNKRELDHLRNNETTNNKTTEETEKPIVLNDKKKPSKKRKHRRRIYFDEKESSTNVTILNGQTALLTCTVRNVGNKSVSYNFHMLYKLFVVRCTIEHK